MVSFKVVLSCKEARSSFGHRITRSCNDFSILAGAVFRGKRIISHVKFRCRNLRFSNRSFGANMSEGDPKKQRVLLIVGIAVVLLLLAGLFFGVKENPFRKPFLTFTVRFDDVSGIHERSKVTFLGIPAGYVKQLDYAPGNRQTAVKVEVVINRKLYIPAAVRAYLEPTLLGDASIALRVRLRQAMPSGLRRRVRRSQNG